MDEILLDILGQRCGQPVEVHLLRPYPLRLDKDLVSGTLGEPDNLILNGRAVPGALSHDLSAVKWGPVHVGPDYLMRPLVGVCYPARNHGAVYLLMHEAERDNLLVSVLTLHPVCMEAGHADPCGGSCLEAAHCEALLPERRPKPYRSLFPESSCAVVILTDEDAPFHEGSGGKHNGP